MFTKTKVLSLEETITKYSNDLEAIGEFLEGFPPIDKMVAEILFWDILLAESFLFYVTPCSLEMTAPRELLSPEKLVQCFTIQKGKTISILLKLSEDHPAYMHLINGKQKLDSAIFHLYKSGLAKRP